MLEHIPLPTHNAVKNSLLKFIDFTLRIAALPRVPERILQFVPKIH